MSRKSPSPRWPVVLTGTLLSFTIAVSGQNASGEARTVAAGAPPRILGPVDAAAWTTLKGSTLPLANPGNDLGRVADATPTGRLLLQLKLSPAQQISLDQLVAGQQDPKSASYHQWLTTAQYAQQFGAPDADIQTISGYLSAQGFSVAGVLPNKTMIEFSGTVGQLRTAFKTEIHSYSTHGQTFFANDRDPQVPAALAPVVAGFVSLNNYRPPTRAIAGSSVALNARTRDKVHALYTDSNTDLLAVAPGDIATIYDIPGSSTGSGVTVGLVGNSNVNLTYYENYRNTFQLGGYAPSVIVDGDDPGVGSDSYLDLVELELVSAVAPKASINYYTSASTDLSTGLNFALIRAIDDDAVQVLVLTQENCEANLGLIGNQFLNNAAEFASSLGMSVIAKSGNGGSAECDSGGADGSTTEGYASKGLAVNGYASSPYVTAVGATDFYYNPPTEATVLNYWNESNGGTAGYTSAMSYIPEQPWNDSNDVNNAEPFQVLVATGGGVSTLGGTSADGNSSIPYAQPSWQLGVVPGTISSTARVVPDVVMFGADGQNGSVYMTCVEAAQCVNATPDAINYGFGAGTESSSAVFAGVSALLVQAHGKQGNLNPALYATYSAKPAAFHDVTNGTNTVQCGNGTPNCGGGGLIVDGSGALAYSAVAGYDAASGLGSVDVSKLISGWVQPETTATSTALTLTAYNTTTPITTFVHGTTVQANITVTSASGTPAGDVAVITGSAAPSNAAVNFTTLSDGTAVETQQVSGLPGGTYPIEARYGGNGSFAPSLSAPITITVTPETSKLEIASLSFTSGSAVTYGAPITAQLYVYSATNVNSIGTPTGSVTVTDGGTALTIIPLDAQGYATFTALLPAGAHSLGFSYSGDVSFQSSSLPSNLTLSVNAQPTGTTLTSSNANDGKGDYVQLVAVVTTSSKSGGTLTWPTGTIYFQTVGQNAKTLGSSAVVPGVSSNGDVAGVANFQLPGSKVPVIAGKPTPIAATFTPASGGNYAASISNIVSLTTTSAATLNTSTVTIATGDGKGSYFDYEGSITLNMTVVGGGAQPTGTVTLYDNGTLLGNATLSGDAATYVISANVDSGLLPMTIGRNVITVQYNGDATHATSTKELALTILAEGSLPDFSLQSNMVFGTISSNSTSVPFTLQLTSINNFAALGQKVTFTAATPTGITCTFGSKTVTFSATANFATNTVTCGAANGYTIALAQPEQRPLGGFWLATGGGAAMAGLLLLGMPARRRSWRKLAGTGLVLMLAIGLSVGAVSGCSSNSAAAASAAQATGSNSISDGVHANANKTLQPGTYPVVITTTAPFATNLQSNTTTDQTHNLTLLIVVQ